MAQSRNYSKSASRALDIIELLADSDQPMRAAEIARHLDLSRSSTDQLLKTMLGSGSLLLRPEDMTYSASPRIARIAHKLADRCAKVDRYRTLIEEVHKRSGQIVTLTLQNDCYMQIQAFAGDFSVPLHIGMQVPLFGSTIGSAALSGKSPQSILKLLKRARRQRLVPRENDWNGAFIDQIKAYRMKGYAWQPMRAYDNRIGRDREMWSIGMRLAASDDIDSPVLGLIGPIASVKGDEYRLINMIRQTLRLLA